MTTVKFVLASALLFVTVSAVGCGGGTPTPRPVGRAVSSSQPGRSVVVPNYRSYEADRDIQRAVNARNESIRRDYRAWIDYTRANPPGNVGNPYGR